MPVKAAFVIYALRRLEFARESGEEADSAIFPGKPRIVLLNKLEITNTLSGLTQ